MSYRKISTKLMEYAREMDTLSQFGLPAKKGGAVGAC